VQKLLGRSDEETDFGVDFAEANAPPMLNYGWVYPQNLLIFTITLVYSVVSPLILVFGATYFGVACELLRDMADRSLFGADLVYKYKLLFSMSLVCRMPLSDPLQSTSSHTNPMARHGGSPSPASCGVSPSSNFS